MKSHGQTTQRPLRARLTGAVRIVSEVLATAALPHRRRNVPHERIESAEVGDITSHLNSPGLRMVNTFRAVL